MSFPEDMIELTAEEFAKLDAYRRQVGALTTRLHLARQRARAADQLVLDIRTLVDPLPHGTPHDSRLCFKCRLDALLSPSSP